jgi:hypothetical protein
VESTKFVPGIHSDRASRKGQRRNSSARPSGIDIRMWMDLCLLENQEEGRTDGPPMSTQEGLVMSAAEIDEYFHAALIHVLEAQPSLFPPDIRTPEDIKAKIQSYTYGM